MDIHWPHYQAARQAAQLLESAGYEAYVIGGAVRDMLLGKTPKDFDLATNATPEQLLQLPGFEKSQYKDTAQAYGVTRVVIEVPQDSQGVQQIELEIATYRRDIEAHLGRTQTKIAFAHLEDDVWRRDFTINALALNPDTNQVVDLVGGLEDLENGLIRFIGDPATRISEDPLRLLRAVRLRHQLDFDYADGTPGAITDAIGGGQLERIASERIKFELSAMLMHPNRKHTLKELEGLGVLARLLPEVAAQRGVQQPPEIHAEGDVWWHCLLTMQFLPDIISPRLAWAALLHDIGKVETAQTAEQTGDRIRFSGHHARGADMARQILKRLGFGKRFRQEVAWMIHYHLAIDDLPHMRPRRAENFMHHPAFADLLELHKADAHAAWSQGDSGDIDTGAADLSQLERLWREFQAASHQHPPSLKRDLGIDGGWLKREFGLSDGPQLGQILDQLQERYLDGEITDASQAKSLVRNLLEAG